ncbi:hypothetical protein C8034_v005561 [Colletotrichum sidae]|uniref:Uncharacterized protein n=1 Tax=Colletotrichum sidae TaxID=1347389 RepID=A0A4R8T665_9PEZI|nr:hypothetical protein C8034_v005561 [Colletotrichum sidae]
MDDFITESKSSPSLPEQPLWHQPARATVLLSAQPNSLILSPTIDFGTSGPYNHETTTARGCLGALRVYSGGTSPRFPVHSVEKIVNAVILFVQAADGICSSPNVCVVTDFTGASQVFICDGPTCKRKCSSDGRAANCS